MPSAPKHSFDSFTHSSTPSVLPSTLPDTNNSTLVAAPSPPPPSQSPSSRYHSLSCPTPAPAPAPPLAPLPFPESVLQGSASCPLPQGEEEEEEEEVHIKDEAKQDKDRPSMYSSSAFAIMSSRRVAVAAVVAGADDDEVGTGAPCAAAQGEAAGVPSLPESVQMPGSPMMRTNLSSFGTLRPLRLGRPVPVSALTTSSQSGTFAGTAMAAADVKGHDEHAAAADMGMNAMDVEAHHNTALLAIDGCRHQGASPADWRLGGGAADAVGLGSVQSFSSSSSSSTWSASFPLASAFASVLGEPSSASSLPLALNSPLDTPNYDNALLFGLGDSLPCAVHSVPPSLVAAVLPAQHSQLSTTTTIAPASFASSLDCNRTSQHAMSAVMSTPSSTHHSTPIGTPTSPSESVAVAPPLTSGSSTNMIPASADVDQLFADMLASASVPASSSLSASESADQAFVNALLSSATDLFSTSSASYQQPPQSSSAPPQPQVLATAQPTPAVPDPELFAFLSTVPEDELQAILAAADAVLDEDTGPTAKGSKPTTPRPASAFQSPMPQPEDRLLSDSDQSGAEWTDDTSSLPDSAFVPPPANPNEVDEDEYRAQESDDEGDEGQARDDDAYKVRYGQRVIQVRTLEEGEVSGMSPPTGVLHSFGGHTTSSASGESDGDDTGRLPVTPSRAGGGRPGRRTSSSPTRSDDVFPPHSDLFAAAELPSAPGPNINSLFERHVVPTLVTSDTESGALSLPVPAKVREDEGEDEGEDEFGSPAAMPVFDDTTTLGAPASTMHQLRFAPLTVWTTAPLPFPQHLQYDAPPTPAPAPPLRPLSAASIASTTTSTTTSALIDSLPWGQSEVVDSPYRRWRPRKPSMRVYPRYPLQQQQQQQQQAYEPSSLHVPMSPASPSSPGVGHRGSTYMSPPPPSYHLSSSASASSALPSPHGSNESVPPGGHDCRPKSPPALASTAWAASAGYTDLAQQQQLHRHRNQEYLTSAAASEPRTRDPYGRPAGGW